MHSADSIIAAVDIGNTRAKFGLFRRAQSGQLTADNIEAVQLGSVAALLAATHAWGDQHQLLQKQCPVMLAGSNPDLREALCDNWPIPSAVPQVVRSYNQIALPLDVTHPESTGIDRLLNAVAARQLCGPDMTVIMVDSGTATTVDLLSSDGVFRGGSILPGLRLSARAMHDYTARLPLLDVDETLVTLPVVPGRNTREAMLSGLFLGQLGAVREIITRLESIIQQRWPSSHPTTILVSGGGGRQLADHLPDARYIDSLALHGLALHGLALLHR